MQYFSSVLLCIILLSVFLNPSKEDFNYHLTKSIKTEIINNGESIYTANLILSLANILLESDDKLIKRSNYYIFSSYEINLSFVRSVGYEIDDIKVLGLFNTFIPIK